MCGQQHFFPVKFCHKEKLKIFFLIAKSENCQICIFAFYCVAKHIEGLLKNHVICRLIWLDLHSDECHFSTSSNG